MSHNQRCVKEKISGVADGWPGKPWVTALGCVCGADPQTSLRLSGAAALVATEKVIFFACVLLLSRGGLFRLFV